MCPPIEAESDGDGHSNHAMSHVYYMYNRRSIARPANNSVRRRMPSCPTRIIRPTRSLRVAKRFMSKNRAKVEAEHKGKFLVITSNR